MTAFIEWGYFAFDWFSLAASRRQATLAALFSVSQPPLGFDPTPIYKSVDHPEFGLLKLTPWRVELTSVATVPPEHKIWYAPEIHSRVI